MALLDMIFIGCLFTGVFFALIQMLLGGLGHLGGHFHIGHFHFHPHFGHLHHEGHGGVSHAGGHHAGTAPQETNGVHHAPHEYGEAEEGVSPLNPMTLGAFITSFGGFGVIARSLGWSPAVSTIFASCMAFVSAGMVFTLFVRFFVASQSSSQFRRIDLLGKKAQVIVSLQANRPGMIAFSIHGAKQTVPAITENGQPIEKGTSVEIVGIAGGSVYVRERDSTE
ncbi:MAG: hypothetical protein IT210_01470 [Armatimonadetes bacterium]|nr:hypothetical protein [Armatimonadota bacterium]